MSIDSTIYRAANLLVEKYGELAPMGATIKADHLKEKGKMDAYEQWMRVAELAEDLLSQTVPDDAQIH